MINNSMKEYDFYLYGEQDAYGQPTITNEVQGQIKMAIYGSNKSVTGDVKYTGEDYVGLTYDKDVSDKYIIQYGEERLKVLYTITVRGLKTQVFMTRM